MDRPGGQADAFDEIVRQFSAEWDAWEERVAKFLVQHGSPPDGRISALTDERERGWLPLEWLDLAEAGHWIAGEIDVLGSWAHLRREQAVEGELKQLFAEIEDGLAAELERFNNWFSGLNTGIDIVEEAGFESFPSSDPPSWWSG